MTGPFSTVKGNLESAIIMGADSAKILHCVEGTGDLVKPDPDDPALVNGFDQDRDWFLFEIEDEAFKKIVVGRGMRRIFGSILFTVYSPDGQASAGGAVISDFIYDKFCATSVGATLLRDVRSIGKYNIDGWRAKVLQVSFEHNVSPN